MADRDTFSRRALLTRAGLTATTAVGLASIEMEPSDALQTSQQANSDSELAVISRLTGHDWSESDHKQLSRSWSGSRAAFRAMRQSGVSWEQEPAFRFVPLTAGYQLPGGRPSVKVGDGPVPKYDGNPESLAFATVADLGRLLRARRITSTELTQMYLDRLKRFGPRLFCVINLCEEAAKRQAAQADAEIRAGKWRGPLHGIPWGAKDLLSTKGTPTTWGIKPYEHRVIDKDAAVVTRLEAAGAILVAKLSLGELAMGDIWFGGTTRNPWNPRQGASGSSAGPGSAVAAGLVGFAIGSETLGSIVSPSVRNGVVGLRPTYGRVPRTGAMTLSWTMDKLGPMCRSVEDCALVLSAIAGPDGYDQTVSPVPFQWRPKLPLKGIRVGYDKAGFDSIATGGDADRKSIYSKVLEDLRTIGVTPIPVTLPATTTVTSGMVSTIINSETACAFQRLVDSEAIKQLVQQNDGSWPNTFRTGSLIPAADYLLAMRHRAALQVEMNLALHDVDVLVTPPFRALVQTNLTGHPTVVVRAGLAKGLPLMVEFIGQPYREDQALRIASAYECAVSHGRIWPDPAKTLVSSSI